MANEPIATGSTAPSGALASISGFFGSLVDKATPVLNTYLGYKTAQQNAASNSTASTSGNGSASWQGTVATSDSITSKPWFPFAVIGAVVGVVLIVVLALRGRKS